MGGIRLGSDGHKALSCREFAESHNPFEPSAIRWPKVDAESLARLKARRTPEPAP